MSSETKVELINPQVGEEMEEEVVLILNEEKSNVSQRILNVIKAVREAVRDLIDTN